VDKGDPWRATGAGVVVTVRVTPRGGRDSIDGVGTLADGRVVLKIRVRVAPEDGAANRAVEKLIARAAGVPPRAARVESGATSRLKQIAIEGEAAMLIERLREAVG
jgi:hypothetical protein